MNSIETLYRDVVEGWNTLDAPRIASAFSRNALMIGYDGSEMKGAAEIESTLSAIFADHRPGRWVTLIRDLQTPAPNLAVLRAHAGWFISADAQSFPQAVQVVVAVAEDTGWKLVLLQTTPAALHGRPEAAAALTKELRAAAASSATR